MHTELLRKQISVLLVEDNEDDAFIVRDYLEEAGPGNFQVTHRNSLETALQALEEDGPADVLLLDLSLPDSDGEVSLRRLRPCTNGCPILVLTGLSDHERALELLHLGADDYITKQNLTRNYLVRSIFFALERQRMERERRHLLQNLETEIEEKRNLRLAHENLERKFAAAIELSGQLIYEFLYDSGTMTLGDCGPLLGYEKGELDNRLETWISRIHPDDREDYSRWLRRAIRERGASSLEYRVLHRDGSHRHVQDNGYHVRDGGRRESVVGIIHDVTERKELENQFQQSQKMEAVGQLAGGVAHDFNNMLSVIIGFSQLAMMKTFPDTELHGYLKEVLEAGKRAGALTRQLLTFSRKEISRPDVLDLNEIIPGMEKMLRRLIGSHVDLVTDLGDDLRKVKADPGQMEQILMNLSINARDAMPSGGTLRITTRNAALEKEKRTAGRVLPPGEYVELRVGDSGTGMDAGTLNRVFEPFFTTKAVGKGTGLGLSTVYGIVEKCGGVVEVESEPGEGTAFTLLLPVCEEEAADITQEIPLHPIRLRTQPKVLVVEDEPGIRDICKRVLTTEGYDLELVESGAEALKWMDEQDTPPDLVLTDLVMPGMTGGKLAEEIQSRHRGVKVLFMSGYDAGMFEELGMETSDIPLLNKPFSMTDLIRKVRESLGDV